MEGITSPFKKEVRSAPRLSKGIKSFAPMGQPEAYSVSDELGECKMAAMEPGGAAENGVAKGGAGGEAGREEEVEVLPRWRSRSAPVWEDGDPPGGFAEEATSAGEVANAEESDSASSWP